YDHYSGGEQVIFHKKLTARQVPHGGGDHKLVDAFLGSLVEERRPMTDPQETLESHLLAFAADRSRLENAVVDMAGFRRWAARLAAPGAGNGTAR
ncbi:MAG: hypothetical protein ACOC8N_10110, partial [Spirochaetota bacterium]